MLFVGLTEDHRGSATMFANVVGAQMISQLRSTNPAAQTAAAEKISGRYLLNESKSSFFSDPLRRLHQFGTY